MQIDFHHGVTWVVARMAGFSSEEAGIIAHSAQYVDDATNQGLIHFDNRMLYERIASAHKMLDYRNFDELADHYAWIPFHFLPGNDGKDTPLTATDERSFIRRMICRPDSPPARRMVADLIQHRGAEPDLHRLGIVLHVYADTWAHQGFCGLQHAVNRATKLQDEQGHSPLSLIKRLSEYFQEKVEAMTGELVGAVLPLGHGAALSWPDLPWLHWRYHNGWGEAVERNNAQDFAAAARALYVACCRYRAGDPALPVSLPDFSALDQLLWQTQDEDGDVRHQVWLDAIAHGTFHDATGEPIKEQLTYQAKGPGSWKAQALGELADIQPAGRVYPWTPAFQQSHWKRFHDALLQHRQYVLLDLLPAYGLLAA